MRLDGSLLEVLLGFDEELLLVVVLGFGSGTHLLVHFLTGPVKATAGWKRVEERPRRAPTPSIGALESVSRTCLWE